MDNKPSIFNVQGKLCATDLQKATAPHFVIPTGKKSTENVCIKKRKPKRKPNLSSTLKNPSYWTYEAKKKYLGDVGFWLTRF